MNEEIKEILDRFNKVKSASNKLSYYPEDLLNRKDMWLLLDYITNLQQENERLKKQLEYLRTDEYLNQVKWERNFNETMNKELNLRIEKAVEYLKSKEDSLFITFSDDMLDHDELIDKKIGTTLLNILEGKDNE